MRTEIETIKTKTSSGYEAEITSADPTDKDSMFMGHVWVEGARYDVTWNENGQAQGANTDPFFDVKKYLLKSYKVKRV